MKKTTVCIVYGDWRELKRMAALLQDEGQEFELVGGFVHKQDADSSMDWELVDVLVVDLDLPNGDGVKLIAEACERKPSLLSIA